MDDYSDRGSRSSKTKKQHVADKRTTLWDEIERSLSIHGVKRIKPGKRSVFFSVVWSLILLCALGMVTYAICNCVQKYLSYPVTINMHIMESVEWPAITLCNLNPVRITQLAKNYWENPATKNTRRQRFEWKQFIEERTFISSREFFLHNAHSAYDMIVSCDAGNIECSINNFTLAQTEDGLCHKITPDKNMDSIELWLNAEAYEYIDGLAHTSGFKVYIHDRNEVPIRDDTHVYIFPGYNFEIIIGLDAYKTLSAPYGLCLASTPPLKKCLSQCYMTRVTAHCGCVPFWYSSKEKGGGSQCNINKHFTCVKDTLDTYHKHCNCIRGCSHTSYTTDLEMYPSNIHSLEDFFNNPQNITTVSKQFERAQDIHSAVSELMYNKDNEIISKFVETYYEGIVLLDRSIHSLYNIKQSTDEELETLQPRIYFHKNIALGGVKQTIQRGYSDVWGRIEMAHLNKIAFDSREVMYKYDMALKQLKFVTVTDMAVRRMFFTVGDSELSAKMDVAAEALENVTKLYYAFKNGEPNLDYEITPQKRYDVALIPYSMLMGNSDYYEKYYIKISNGLGNYIQSIVKLKKLIKSTLSNRNYDEKEKNTTSSEFLTYASEIGTAKDSFKKSVVEKYENVIDEKIKYMDTLNNSYLNSASDLRSHISSIRSHLATIHLRIFEDMGHLINFSNSYLHHSNVSKANLVYTFTTSDVTLFIHDIEQTTIELFLEYRKLLTLLENLQRDIILIWKTFFSENLLRNFYIKLNNDVVEMISDGKKTRFFLNIFTHEKMLNEPFENQTEVLLAKFLVLLNADIPLKDFESTTRELNQTFQTVTGIVKDADQLVITLKSLKEGLATTHNYLKDYEQGLQLGSSFAKKNLIKLKISENPSHHRMWTQEVAYPISALLAEVGLMIAIMLGASMLSALEFCDILLAWFSDKFCPDNRPPPDVNKSFPSEYRKKYQLAATESLNSSRDPRELDLNSTLNSNRRSYVTFKDFNHITGSEV